LKPLEVVYADDALVVLNKPSGLLAVPGKTSNECLSLQVQQQFADALIVHRLDMATSGLMVMARGIAMQRALNQSFSERRVHKRYVAIVQGPCGTPTYADDDAGWQLIDLPIIVDWPNRPLRKIDQVNGKPSQTHWRSVHYDAQHNTSRLELEPVTGRSHQLRVHLQAIGHPILGDTLYAPAEVAAASERLLLHATALAFAHPQTHAWVSFHAPDAFGAWP
jgi:tRNA pseudouridine32 synthase/23S rRNA pseudouridine746 synthase